MSLITGTLLKALDEGKLDEEIAESIWRFAELEESGWVSAPQVVR